MIENKQEKWYISLLGLLALVALILVLIWLWENKEEAAMKYSDKRVEALVAQYHRLSPLEQRRFEELVKEAQRKELDKLKRFLHGAE